MSAERLPFVRYTLADTMEDI